MISSDSLYIVRFNSEWLTWFSSYVFTIASDAESWASLMASKVGYCESWEIVNLFSVVSKFEDYLTSYGS